MTIFYETREPAVLERNRGLKKTLNDFYFSQPEAIRTRVARIAAINCSSAFPLFKGVWKGKLSDHSTNEGLTVYCDWDGSFAKAYGTVDDESNFLIVDRKGTVRFSRSGKIAEREFDGIKQLLESLAQ